MAGNNLKKIRKECGLTQAQVAEALGLERSTYTYYETGKTDPSIHTLKKIMTLFNCSFADVYPSEDDTAKVYSTKTIENYFQTEHLKIAEPFSPYNAGATLPYLNEREMIENYRLLSNEDKKKIFEEIQELVRRISE